MIILLETTPERLLSINLHKDFPASWYASITGVLHPRRMRDCRSPRRSERFGWISPEQFPPIRSIPGLTLLFIFWTKDNHTLRSWTKIVLKQLNYDLFENTGNTTPHAYRDGVVPHYQGMS